MVKLGCFFALLLASWPLWALTQLTAQLDKNPAMVGEAIVLEVTADARLSAEQLNFRVLENDFRITAPSVSQSTRVVNGQASHSTSWRLSLFAREPGQYTIPAFTVNNVSSSPIELEVLAANQSDAGQPELFLQAELAQDTWYVQQSGYYTLTIYFQGDLQRGSLTEPSMEGATIQQIGNDEEGSELVNGTRYRTITRRFAVIPQRSGDFVIKAPEFTGEMLDRDSARYNYFARTKTIMQRADDLDVSVRAAPHDFPGSWLVAGLVTLNEEWSQEPAEFTVGEPITRTITLSGVDLAPNQLPDIQIPYPDGLRLYPQTPNSQGAQRNGRLVAQKTFSSAIIPATEGTLELPEVKIPWWNSQRDQLEYATIPARQIQVKPGQVSQQPLPASVTDSRSGDEPTPIIAVSQWAWTHSSTAVLLGWLASLLLFWRLRRGANKSQSPAASPPYNHSTLKKACQHNQPAVARDALLYWARQQIQADILSISELAAWVDEPLSIEINKLNKAIYHPAGGEWQGQDLWQAWKNYQPTMNKKASSESLTSLYPQ
ncbi:BatD family protein [Alkalimonas collagenimarina]|uniref:BatD family protein n=1 Tax=Alkalimonas collagenimarina TaxID=400390 RepID=A0ABT9GZB3_9GAMM|nr:BatD family protein [Alkalimonas collagenimarina]MDP4536404.1 BatD family protein [Alkalimonas collagenimarina]